MTINQYIRGKSLDFLFVFFFPVPSSQWSLIRISRMKNLMIDGC